MDTSIKASTKCRIGFATLLMLALLSLQAVLLVHSYELDSHEEGGFCELCVQGSHAKFLSSAAVSLFVDSAPYAFISTSIFTTQPSEPLRHYAARAPPLYSL